LVAVVGQADPTAPASFAGEPIGPAASTVRTADVIVGGSHHEDLFGRPVDLVSVSSIRHPCFRASR